ncbi:gamma-glutamyl-gamma-aminobutyrate hydrolase family protein [Acidocella aminolytica]|jgi:putative glutamine amidotransferase|uniref:Peptidase C26/glutamine amidotransferase n=1 Tax=Acidocella aminolytica 101 = DSM 11237 TaxID=1120923 RepID=A0A0D6PJU1_9PROT|nr:gamma-glutamyl-gamma-aminobutyrate hydrolase family protein [Acidocella aminolytica]GAN81054.1 peptidase C26/glutamine amidotransferase [Acidocella aminolytica 101 = DSM 11237]GBQ42785.1 peptidase C26 [Acidocella aminolytica 101 = DSM 11237]SHF18540.1 putative glutamine amidotransferase [Acidocella aminolytica 101 = DSM 11237]
MPKPLIGLTSYARNEQNRYELPANYLECVYRAGGTPVVLTPVGSGQSVPDWLDCLDGLVFTGGHDLDPALYGEQRHPTTEQISQERDQSEMILTHSALESGIPMLAICRGLQILNVALDGTLHQHLPESIGELVAHRASGDKPARHSSYLVPGSRLHEISGYNVTEGVSWHHQGINTLAPRLTPVAYADDCLIEAVELKDHPWCIGVQWHPEMSAESDPVQQRLFDALVQAASK